MVSRSAPAANEVRRTSVPRLVTALGWSGLLPFVFLTAVTFAAEPPWPQMARRALLFYAAAIFCFLCGAWWGIGLMRQRCAPVLASNIWLLAAVSACVFLPERGALVVLASGLLGLWLAEGRMSVFGRQPGYYRRMRGWLSLVAAAALLLSATRQFA